MKTQEHIIKFATEIAFNKLINRTIEDGLFKSDLSKLAFKNLPMMQFKDPQVIQQFKDVCESILNILIKDDENEQKQEG